MRRWRIAMVSEHASPLAMLGGVDAGGQNIHVAELAGALARRGHAVRVYTRRDDPDIAPVVPFGPGVDVEHVPAGPPTPLPKDELLPYMGEFGRYLAARWEADFTPAVVHAHFWMSGLAALTATAIRPIPVVVTYHALGSVKRRFQGEEDTSPPSRQGLERELGLLADRVIAQCGDEVEELGRMGIPRTHISVIPSGVNIERFTTGGSAAGPPVVNRSMLTPDGITEMWVRGMPIRPSSSTSSPHCAMTRSASRPSSRSRPCRLGGLVSSSPWKRRFTEPSAW